jgi:hypothetical protein
MPSSRGRNSLKSQAAFRPEPCSPSHQGNRLMTKAASGRVRQDLPGKGEWGEDGPARAGQAAASDRARRRADCYAAGRDRRGTCSMCWTRWRRRRPASVRSRIHGRTRRPTPHGRLMLTVLGGLAEFERELIRARTGEGRSRAKARGVRFGRPPKLTAHQRREAFQRLANGETQARAHEG